MADPTPKPLSPAAQAVLDAITAELDHAPWELSYLAGLSAAAACRAVVYQVVPELGRSPDDSREDERLCVRDEILAIAVELEGHHG